MKLAMLINVKIPNDYWHFNIHKHDKDSTFIMQLHYLNVCKRFVKEFSIDSCLSHTRQYQSENIHETRHEAFD